MLKKMSFITLILVTSFGAKALTLAPISNPNDAPLPIKAGEPPIACDQIINRLVAYNQMARQHDQSLTSFLGDVTQKVNDWYSQLSPLENTPQTLAAGTFLPLKEGSDKISQLTDMAYDNSALLAAELDHIIGSMRACSPVKNK